MGSSWWRAWSKYDAMTENPKQFIDAGLGPASGACPVEEAWDAEGGAKLLTGLPEMSIRIAKKNPVQANVAFAGLS